MTITYAEQLTAAAQQRLRHGSYGNPEPIETCWDRHWCRYMEDCQHAPHTPNPDTALFGGRLYSPVANSIYTDDDLVFDGGLLGTWAADSETWTFEQVGDTAYKLTIRESDTKRPVVLSAHLVQIKAHRLLDLSLGENSELPELEEMESFHLLPAHSFWYVKREGDSLYLRTFSQDWLEERMKKGRLWVDHVEVDDRLVFTAKTERVQRFLAKWGSHDRALGEWETITRK